MRTLECLAAIRFTELRPPGCAHRYIPLPRAAASPDRVLLQGRAATSPKEDHHAVRFPEAHLSSSHVRRLPFTAPDEPGYQEAVHRLAGGWVGPSAGGPDKPSGTAGGAVRVLHVRVELDQANLRDERVGDDTRGSHQNALEQRAVRERVPRGWPVHAD